MARLGDVFPLIRNGASIKQTDGAGGYPITRIETIANREVDRSKFGYADIEDVAKYQDYLLQDGDILMSHINSEKHLGKVALYHAVNEEKIVHGMNLLMLRADRDLIQSNYAAYFFNSDAFLRQIPNITKKYVNQASFTVTALKELTIPVPQLSKQEEISEKLDRISNLISLRKQQLAKLDELVKARFVELFGDPVTNEKNWPRVTLGDICEIGSSKRVFEKDYVPSGIPFFRTKEIVELSKGNPISTELFITEEHFAELKKSYGAPKKDDLLISAVGTIGTIWIVSGDFEFYFKDGNLIQIKSSPTFNSIFMKYLLDELIANYKKEMSTGTAYSALTIAGLKKMLVYDVPLEFQKKFAAFVKQTDKSKLAIQQSLDKLETLKKSLMQKYFG